MSKRLKSRELETILLNRTLRYRAFGLTHVLSSPTAMPQSTALTAPRQKPCSNKGVSSGSTMPERRQADQGGDGALSRPCSGVLTKFEFLQLAYKKRYANSLLAKLRTC
eukprot:6182881-Pleurochrysis_carterae.AAC.2